MDFDEEFLQELCKVEGIEPRDVFEWARGESLPVSMAWVEEAYSNIPDEERGKWASIEEVENNVERESVQQKIRREGIKHVPFRREDERYRHPEIIEEKEKNVVVVNIRDVSGSMREKKRELVERTFTPLDWYLQGKYDNAEFVYIAHDADAWEVERRVLRHPERRRHQDLERIRTCQPAARGVPLERLEPVRLRGRRLGELLERHRRARDPLMEQIPANLHAYVETQPSGNAINATHAEELERHFGTDAEDVAVAYVNDEADVTDAIYEILSTESDDNE